jgi:clan AA aspartic protease
LCETPASAANARYGCAPRFFGYHAVPTARYIAAMGSFRVAVDIANPAGGPFQRVDALVDTGATYSWVPADLLRRLGVEPEEEWPFVLADGREVTYPIGSVRLRFAGRTRSTVTVFGVPDSEPLLGVVTLEELGLAADPVNRRLIPVPGLLKLA